jgi:hypothetical protein
MTRLNPSASADDLAAEGSAAPAGHVNGQPGGPGAAASPDEPAIEPRSGIDRAEVIADHLAERVGVLSAALTKKLVTLASRAREVAQDFWSEVQSVRRGDRP